MNRGLNPIMRHLKSRLPSHRLCVWCVALSGLGAFNADALDDSRLWLPKSYRSHYVALVNAALAAEATNRCVTVLEGTIDLTLSSQEKAVFRILCRQESGVSYNEIVDGDSYETLTTPTQSDSYWSEDARLEREMQVRKKEFWSRCDAMLKVRTRLMNDLQWVSEVPSPPVTISETSAEYLVDFDAKTPEGTILKYRARCSVSDSQDAQVEITRRPD